jgi:2-polyprenyl-3-methyl-5-hydroxy-6-metoxy-1,4-benzoquinol methylase
MSDFRFTERAAANLNLLPVALHDAFPAVLFGRVLVLSTRLGLFEALEHRPLNAGEVSAEVKLPGESTELLLASLRAKGYLKKRREHYSLAPQARKWLLRSSPHYIGNFLHYVELLHAHWITLEHSLRYGKPERGYTETFTPREWQIYTDGMMDLARLILPRLLPKLRLPEDARSLLDIGGSHGLYSIELCKRTPGLRATVADLPPVLERTREIVREHGLSDRISLLPCDVTSSSFDLARYDVALLFNIVHGLAPAHNRALLGRIAAALKPGGMIFILDQFKREQSRGADRFLPLMVGINLLNETGGNAYDAGEVRAWCLEAGFTKVGTQRLFLPGLGLLSARKT